MSDKVYQIKPCPFCGEKYLGFNDTICLGESDSPFNWWDSGLRGEKCGYVMCYKCGIVLKANDLQEAIEAWNKRTREPDMVSAIDALKNSISKTVKLESEGNQAYCPTCYHFFKDEEHGFDYCPDCGQHLSWGNDHVVIFQGGENDDG